ncbi:MAG: DUF4197 domain-containing protein [Mariniphaga sp.]
MKNIKYAVVVSFVLLFTSCAELMQIAQDAAGGDKQLTRSEIVAGLKEALIIGTNKAVETLGVTNGYYEDQAVKILLPPEADVIIENIGKVPGGQALLDDVLLRINRAAEDAVSEAGPIFVNSIKSMTINDAVGILQGEEDAATQYLHRTTYDQLFTLYSPKIEASLDKKLVGNLSPSESWDALVGRWNQMARSVVGQVAGFEPVEVNLEDYLTGEALDGLFMKIENEEQRIRENPAARVTDLLKRVFGSAETV